MYGTPWALGDNLAYDETEIALEKQGWQNAVFGRIGLAKRGPDADQGPDIDLF